MFKLGDWNSKNKFGFQEENYLKSTTPKIVIYGTHFGELFYIYINTGLGLLVVERVDSRGIVVVLEHPAYAVFWDKIGQKHARRLTATHNQMCRIQMKKSESIEKSLLRVAANETNLFDFMFHDNSKRESYLDDDEHAIQFIYSGWQLVINQFAQLCSGTVGQKLHVKLQECNTEIVLAVAAFGKQFFRLCLRVWDSLFELVGCLVGEHICSFVQMSLHYKMYYETSRKYLVGR
ncbi:hypothetical protein CRE_00886 [Caenorhabditis remanei]|uniref:Uncharacterized protein n=2 Tax=Caenorhabditis remanei TaxID=31234 RepID=E3LEX2_CAERE|nr:hypothetical protein CRE_00886 [Caenorhabditis remanei]